MAPGGYARARVRKQSDGMWHAYHGSRWVGASSHWGAALAMANVEPYDFPNGDRLVWDQRVPYRR